MDFTLSLWKIRYSLVKENSQLTQKHQLSIQKCIELAELLCAQPDSILIRDQYLIPPNPVPYFKLQSLPLRV